MLSFDESQGGAQWLGTRVQPVGARVGPYEVRRPANDILVKSDRAIAAQHCLQIRGFELAAGAGEEFEARNRGKGPGIVEVFLVGPPCRFLV